MYKKTQIATWAIRFLLMLLCTMVIPTPLKFIFGILCVFCLFALIVVFLFMPTEN